MQVNPVTVLQEECERLRAETAQRSLDEERNMNTTLRAELTSSRKESDEFRQLINDAVTDFDELPGVSADGFHEVHL